MARRKQSRGNCTYCNREMTRGGLSRHLKSCSARQEAIAQAKGADTTLYHLQVQDAWGGDFWLHLEMKGTAKLKDLDNYLRAIWLECCGHLSDFFIGGAWANKVAMSRQIAQVFEPDVELTHIYDFGTSSETKIRCVAVRQGNALTKHPITLMARNNPPEVQCMECDQLATHLCMECQYEYDESGLLCDAHVEDHPHDDYGEPMLLYNSPRVGLCGYSGPAEPPY